MNDLQLLLKAAASGVAASFNGNPIDLISATGFSPGEAGMPVQADIPITSLDHTTGDETYAFKLQDSPDQATWTDITANRLASDYGGPNANNVEGIVRLFGAVMQRYVRLVGTLGGTTPVLNHMDIFLQPIVMTR